MPPTKKRTPSKRKPRSLVVARLENISKIVFRKHYDLITEIIGNSPGIWYIKNSEGDWVKLADYTG